MQNKLKQELGLTDTALETFYSYPDEYRFRKLTREEQTVDLIEYVIEHNLKNVITSDAKMRCWNVYAMLNNGKYKHLSSLDSDTIERLYHKIINMVPKEDIIIHEKLPEYTTVELRKFLLDIYKQFEKIENEQCKKRLVGHENTTESESCHNDYSAIASQATEPSTNIISLTTTEIALPTSDTALITTDENATITHELAKIDEPSTENIYYISDIHLEHQLKPLITKRKKSRGKIANKLQSLFIKDEITLEKLKNAISTKIEEMVSEIDIFDRRSTLLVAGDVANNSFLVDLFYKTLYEHWGGDIISVLGNHELWDENNKTVDEIIDEYRKKTSYKFTLLENSVFIKYKNKKYANKIITEEQILNSDIDDLKEILSQSSKIILGGIGFSGLNPKYNAEYGLYKNTITSIDEDKALSNRFLAVYNKILECASDMNVIVLTHMPVNDWTNQPYNPNWIYVNGHTHQNSLIRNKDGTTVLSDNQIGYNPRKWKLNKFTINGWYNPLKYLPDGIHELTKDVYMDFNIGRGINIEGCKHKGQIYVLKRNDNYMFVLESKTSLCLLVGGSRYKLANKDKQYYYDNMLLYIDTIKNAIQPYNQALQKISEEIKSFGGTGIIHGCIVDISFFTHVYLNPFDGKITPYYAPDATEQYAYDDIQSLLEYHCSELITPYLTSQKIHLLKSCHNSDKTIAIPEIVMDTQAVYAPSRVMRSIQYIFDKDVIRVWKYEVLSVQDTALLDKL